MDRLRHGTGLGEKVMCTGDGKDREGSERNRSDP
jgi:hypothetical protein